jgi:hypothetical protein
VRIKIRKAIKYPVESCNTKGTINNIVAAGTMHEIIERNFILNALIPIIPVYTR